MAPGERMSTIESLLQGIRIDAPVRQVLVGAVYTAVVLDSTPPSCGLAATLFQHSVERGAPPVPDAGRLCARSGRELAQMLRSPSWLEASIGMAALNALLEVDDSVCVDRNGGGLIQEMGAGRRVAIIGHFPFVPQVRAMAAECWVLEQRPAPGDLPAERAPDVLPQADVVGVTGTTLINGTFDELIKLCRSDAYVVLLGASAPLTPLLFEHGVSAICGTRVVDVPAALAAVGEGATFRQIPGKRLLTMTRERPR